MSETEAEGDLTPEEEVRVIFGGKTGQDIADFGKMEEGAASQETHVVLRNSKSQGNQFSSRGSRRNTTC